MNQKNYKSCNNLIKTARQFATIAHRDQLRKYTKAPYIEHPEAVAALVASVTADPRIIAAALLHDVVEETPIQLDDIDSIFGHRVMELVEQVTNVSRSSEGKYKARKDLDRLHLAKADPDGQTIKLADLIDNAGSIVPHDPGFAKVYMAEKRHLLTVLTAGHPALLPVPRPLSMAIPKRIDRALWATRQSYRSRFKVQPGCRHARLSVTPFFNYRPMSWFSA